MTTTTRQPKDPNNYYQEAEARTERCCDTCGRDIRVGSRILRGRVFGIFVVDHRSCGLRQGLEILPEVK